MKPCTAGLSLELLPLEGYVHIDRVADGRFVVTHTISRESVELPEGCWDLVWGDDGFGCVCNVSLADMDDEVRMLDDVFKFTVLHDEAGNYFLASSGSTGNDELLSLDIFKKKFQELIMRFPMGVTKCEHQLLASLWKWPRLGARLFFSTKSIYEAMGFDQFARHPWRWSCQGAPRWATYAESLGLPGHVMMSTKAPLDVSGSSRSAEGWPGNSNSINTHSWRDSAAFVVSPRLRMCWSLFGGFAMPRLVWQVIHARGWAGVMRRLVVRHAKASELTGGESRETSVLPYFGVSVWALLALLCRWAYCAEERGGMKKADHREACQQLLAVLFGILADAEQDWSITLDMAPNAWVNRWPRPSVQRTPVAIVVQPGGQLNMSGWKEHPDLGSLDGRHPMRKWLSMVLGGLQVQTLQELFKLVATTDPLRELYKQLLWACGWRLQVVLLRHFKKDGPASARFNLADIGCDELVGASHTLDRVLVRYSLACRSASLGHSSITVSTDKATVCGMSLQQCIVTLPNNVGIVAPPQVFGGGGRICLDDHQGSHCGKCIGRCVCGVGTGRMRAATRAPLRAVFLWAPETEIGEWVTYFLWMSRNIVQKQLPYPIASSDARGSKSVGPGLSG